jgi:hypothetical protein
MIVDAREDLDAEMLASMDTGDKIIECVSYNSLTPVAQIGVIAGIMHVATLPPEKQTLAAVDEWTDIKVNEAAAREVWQILAGCSPHGRMRVIANMLSAWHMSNEPHVEATQVCSSN